MEPADAVSLVILYTGAFLTPLIAGRLHLPAAVGEILFGVAVGSAGLGWVHPTDFTEFLSRLGFLFLMFLVGMEIDFNRIERGGRGRLALAALVAAFTLGTAALVAWQLGYSLFLAIILGAMSVGIVLVAVVEAGVSQTRFGQMVLLVGSIGEVLTLVSLTAFNLVYRFGIGQKLVEEIVKALLILPVAYAVLSVLRLSVWWFPHNFRRWVHIDDPSEIGVRAGFGLMLSLAALAGWVGLEPIMGAFLAGTLFSFVFRGKGVLETKLSAVGQGFFVPLFFISVGLSLDLGALGDVDTVARALMFLAAASLLAKLLPSFLLMFVGFRVREVTAAAFLLATPLTLLVAAASIGEQLGILDAGMSSTVVLFSILSGVAFPTTFKLLASRFSPPPADLGPSLAPLNGRGQTS
jgi:Kef-type K+ transport system membrane component KefB